MIRFEIYHDSHDTYYRDPFGAVACGNNIKLKLKITGEIPIDKCELRLWEDNREKILTLDLQDGEWDEGKDQIFQIDYRVPEVPGLIWYYFRLTVDGKMFFYGNNSENLGGKGTLFKDSPSGYQITTYKPSKVPDWYKEGVMYQIFVDRFSSHGDNILSTGGQEGDLYHLDWNDTPFYVKDETGRVTRWNFFGGNLEGITKKLDYLKDLGVTILYLNPIFKAPSNHKYDTGDYMTIDPAFGDGEIFRELIDESKARGISVILDGVFSHTGSDSIYFNREGNYPGLGAFQSKDSPYYKWYKFKDYPHEYESWWGVDVLPNVNEMEPSYRDFIYSGEDSVIKHWIREGVKGWRLDVADELPDEFIKGIRKAMKETDEESVLMGEVWEDASNKRSYGQLREYFWGDELDSTMNYPIREIWLDFLLGKHGAEMAHRRIMNIYENYPRENFYAGMNLVGSHDRIRILTLLGGAPPEKSLNESQKESYKLGREARALGIKRLKLISLMQMAFPGVPCVYYGDEAGVEGYTDPYNRKTYPWGKEDKEILDWYRRVMNLRSQHSALRGGDFKSFNIGEEVYGFQREDSYEQIIILINRSQTREWKGSLDQGLGLELEDIKAIEDKYGEIILPPLGGKMFCVENKQ